MPSTASELSTPTASASPPELARLGGHVGGHVYAVGQYHAGEIEQRRHRHHVHMRLYRHPGHVGAAVRHHPAEQVAGAAALYLAGVVAFGYRLCAYELLEFANGHLHHFLSG